jgi:Na+/melibiose symporter-like transporter
VVVAGGDGRDGYALMGLVVGAILFAMLLAAFAGTRRTRVVEPVVSTAPLRQQIRAATDNAAFLWLLAAFVLQALGVGTALAGVDFFAEYTLDDDTLTTPLFLALVGPALVAMPLWNWVGHRYGKRFGFQVCVAIFAGGGLALLAASPQRLWLAYAAVVVMGTAYAGTQMFPFAMLPDTIDADFAATGLRRAGAFTGVWTAGEKAGMALGPAVMAGVLAVTGFVESDAGVVVAQPDSARTGIVVGFAVVPAALMLASLALIRHYRDPAPTRSA